MVPVLGGEVEEGEQRFPIFGQAGDCLVVLGAVFVGEHVDRRLGRRAGRRAVNLAKVGLHIDLHRERDASGSTAPNSGGPGRSPQHEYRTGSNQIEENLESTQRWNDVPRGTMDEVSSYVRL